jgi:uncharacterized protein YrrD
MNIFVLILNKGKRMFDKVVKINWFRAKKCLQRKENSTEFEKEIVIKVGTEENKTKSAGHTKYIIIRSALMFKTQKIILLLPMRDIFETATGHQKIRF